MVEESQKESTHVTNTEQIPTKVFLMCLCVSITEHTIYYYNKMNNRDSSKSLNKNK